MSATIQIVGLFGGKVMRLSLFGCNDDLAQWSLYGRVVEIDSMQFIWDNAPNMSEKKPFEMRDNSKLSKLVF